MANAIERLEELAEKATPRPWSTDASKAEGSWPYAVETPEGGIVADDIESSQDADLIVLAVTALPDLLKLARAAWRIGWNDRNGKCWCPEAHEDERAKVPHTNECVALRAVLESLFREEGQG